MLRDQCIFLIPCAQIPACHSITTYLRTLARELVGTTQTQNALQYNHFGYL